MTKPTRYVVTGSIGYVVNLVVLLGSIRIGLNPYAALGIAYVANTASNYALNRMWTFQSRTNSMSREASRFTVVALVLLALNYGTFAFFFEVLEWREAVAQTASILIGLPVGFSLNSRWAFNSASGRPSGESAVRQSGLRRWSLGPRRLLCRAPRWRHVLLVLAGLATINTAYAAVTIPPGAGEDEANYLAVSRYVASEHAIPEFGANDDLSAKALFGHAYPSYVDRPGLPLYIAGFFVALSPDGAGSDFRQARIPGVFYAGLLVILVGGAAVSLGASRMAAITAAAIAACWPRTTQVLATLNDDGLTLVLVAAIIWSWSAGSRRNWPKSQVIALGALIGLFLLCKPNGFFVAALSLVVVIGIRPWTRALGMFSLAAATGAIVAAWRYWIAYEMYRPSFFASDLFDAKYQELGVTMLPSGMALGHESFLGYVLWWLRVTAPTTLIEPKFTWPWVDHGEVMFHITLIICTLAIAGWVLSIPRLASRVWVDGLRDYLPHIATFLTIPAVIGAAAGYAYYDAAVMNGKYNILALPALWIGTAVGLEWLGMTRIRSAVLLSSAAVFSAVAGAYFMHSGVPVVFEAVPGCCSPNSAFLRGAISFAWVAASVVGATLYLRLMYDEASKREYGLDMSLAGPVTQDQSRDAGDLIVS